ncbi:MAG: class I SAM-dependent methyltransferase family protein [Promethearchaeota archaeon]|nr:MAG: class I SAM-dependent methyltransferase family protein [Candidatus Lokiarchaeota archaeon]
MMKTNQNETEQYQFLKLEKKNAQKFLNFIKNNFKNESVINNEFKILKESKYILFPLVKNAEIIESIQNLLQNKFPFEIKTRKPLRNAGYKYRTIDEALKHELQEENLDLIPRSYDIIGDIAIIEFDKFNSRKKGHDKSLKKKIAKAITLVNNNVESVYEKTSKIKGTYRLREMKHLHGVKKTETIHKENHCYFKLDIKKTFFTPRLVFERKRISQSDISIHELIMDLFAGVGPFSIQIAKINEVVLHSFDVNPFSFDYLKENINLNEIKGNIIPHNLDIKQLLKTSNDLGQDLKSKADRILMNLPENSLEYLDVACFLMKPSGGILHSYQFCEKPNPVELAEENLKNALKDHGWVLEGLNDARIVKAFSPKKELVVLDAKIRRSEF